MHIHSWTEDTILKACFCSSSVCSQTQHYRLDSKCQWQSQTIKNHCILHTVQDLRCKHIWHQGVCQHNCRLFISYPEALPHPCKRLWSRDMTQLSGGGRVGRLGLGNWGGIGRPSAQVTEYFKNTCDVTWPQAKARAMKSTWVRCYRLFFQNSPTVYFSVNWNCAILMKWYLFCNNHSTTNASNEYKI